MHRGAQRFSIAHVARDELHAIAMRLLKPLDVPGDSGPGEIVIDDHPLARRQQPVREVAADESGSASDQRGAIEPRDARLSAWQNVPLAFDGLHTVSPRDASASRA